MEISWLEGNSGSSNVKCSPETSKKWMCHIEWFKVEGCSFSYGPMIVSSPRPPTEILPGGNQPSESSMGHVGSSGRNALLNSISEESENIQGLVPSSNG